MDRLESSSSPRRIPLWIKIAYPAFLAVMVPTYWRDYGPTNFLYLCDAAAFLTLAALWSESALLASVAAVGIVFPQLVWVLDFCVHFAGLKITGMSDYMFDPKIHCSRGGSRSSTAGCLSFSYTRSGASAMTAADLQSGWAWLGL